MKIRINHKGFTKYIIAVVVAIGVALTVELLMNFHAFRSSSEEIDVSSQICNTRIEESYTFQIINVEYSTSHYIDKILISGEFEANNTITVNFKTINGFDQEESIQIKSVNDKAVNDIVINIGDRVLSYQVLVECGLQPYTVNSVKELNYITFNTCRFMLVTVSVILLALLTPFFDVKKNVVAFFVIASVGLGSVMIFSTGMRRSTWDEEVHFYYVYTLAGDKETDWNDAAWRVSNRRIPSYDTQIEKENVDSRMDALANTHHHYEDRGLYTIPFGHGFAYIPMSVGYKLATSVGMSFSAAYRVAKFVNLFMYTSVIAYAIHVSKNRKLFIAAISLMPTTLLQGSMITYDGIVYSFITLGVVLLCNEIENRTLKLNGYNVIWGMALIIFGSAAKAIYAPLLLLVLFLPSNAFASPKFRRAFRITTGAIFIITMSTFILPLLSSTVSGNSDFGGDPRGGNTSAAAQLVSMLSHPIDTVKLFFNNIFAFDNLRNMGSAASDNYMLTSLMFLNQGFYGVLNDKWNMIVIPILFTLFFYREDKSSYEYSGKQRIGISVIILSIVGMIWAAMYLSFTTIGSEVINGVQARYYLPLLLPTSLVLANNKLDINVKPVNLYRIVLGVVCYLEFYCIFNNIVSLSL